MWLPCNRLEGLTNLLSTKLPPADTSLLFAQLICKNSYGKKSSKLQFKLYLNSSS